MSFRPQRGGEPESRKEYAITGLLLLDRIQHRPRENDERFDIRLNVSRLFQYQTLLGILSPMVAVM
ncbi:MAG: hypothetical protein PVH37_19900, partial [Desulfobacterales bacterium]